MMLVEWSCYLSFKSVEVVLVKSSVQALNHVFKLSSFGRSVLVSIKKIYKKKNKKKIYKKNFRDRNDHASA